jgi:mRNA-decapping enzyme 1B
MTILASRLMYAHKFAAFMVGYMLHHIISVVSNYAEIAFPTYLQGAASIGSVSNAQPSGRVHPSTESIPSSHVPLIVPSAASTHQLPPSVASTASPLPVHGTNAHTSRPTNLVTPDFFAPPPSSSAPLAPPGASVVPTAPPLHPTSAASIQRSQYGTPLLQPFPPPTPPPSLNPSHSDRLTVTRDRVKDALQRLVQVKIVHTENIQGTTVLDRYHHFL